MHGALPLVWPSPEPSISPLPTEPRLRFTRPLQDVEGREHGIAVLECKVPNSRIPTAWFREDQRLLPCRKYEQIEEGAVRRLIIHRLKADDDGVYLCEMRGRVRTVANVTVKGGLASGRRPRLRQADAQAPGWGIPVLFSGPILKRLPRKLDVLEGENAVLLVETQEAGVQGRWSRDGEDLPTICQSSSGHMHALVLPGVTREDAGEVTFSLGNSRTTTLLRVKCEGRKARGQTDSSRAGQEGQGRRVTRCQSLGWQSGLKLGGLWEAGAGLECKPCLCLRRQAQPPGTPGIGRDVQGP